MSGNHLTLSFLLNPVAILQLILFWNVEAVVDTNFTMIDIINSLNSTWRAGENPVRIPDWNSKVDIQDGSWPILEWKNTTTPDSFDSRKYWMHCRSIISQIREQGNCASCWAVIASSMLSDRICIETNGGIRVHLSAEDVITCCSMCHRPGRSSCQDGFRDKVVDFWIGDGIVTGGEIESKEGCKPYSRASFHFRRDQECKRVCSNRRYPKKYEEDKHFGRLRYYVFPTENSIKREILCHGPVSAGMLLYEDFRVYRTGVYRHLRGKPLGGHSLKIIGWGVDRGTKYWLATNSWGIGWGMKGYVKFLRGENHCLIEGLVIAGRVFSNLSPSERLREARFGGLNRGNLLCVQRLLFYALCIWTLEQTL